MARPRWLVVAWHTEHVKQDVVEPGASGPYHNLGPWFLIWQIGRRERDRLATVNSPVSRAAEILTGSLRQQHLLIVAIALQPDGQTWHEDSSQVASRGCNIAQRLPMRPHAIVIQLFSVKPLTLGCRKVCAKCPLVVLGWGIRSGTLDAIRIPAT